MKISIAFADQPTTQEVLDVEKKLSQGKFDVYQIYSPSHKTTYALKVFPKDSFGISQYQNEKLMFHLNHPNIIQNIPVLCQDSQFCVLLTEFAKYGDFFDLTNLGLLSDEILIRTYFRQLIEGLEHIHSNGIAHLDLKLENILLGSDFRLKIIDFDQAQPIVETSIMSAGTKSYRAPEVLYGTCQNLAAADIYSAGIILYVLKAQRYPFVEKKENRRIILQSYATFLQDKEKFWRSKAQKFGDKKFFSEDFIKLVNGMLQIDPEKRMTIKDIKKSDWYNGPVLSMDRLKVEMERRIAALKQNKVEN